MLKVISESLFLDGSFTKFKIKENFSEFKTNAVLNSKKIPFKN